VRNRYTLIYSGADLAKVDESEQLDRWNDLGTLAMGEVGEVGEACGLSVGDRIIWNGPHADWGELDAGRNVWARIGEWDPQLLAAGIGAEATPGLRRAIGALGAVPTHALLIGQGMLGNLAAQWLKREGASVTVVENSPKRLEFSKYLGLRRKIDTHNVDWRDRLRGWNPGGVELIVEASGYIRPLVETMEFLRPGGAIQLLGNWRPQFGGAAPPDELAAIVESKRARWLAPPPAFGEDKRAQEQALAEWIEWISKGEIGVDRLITHRVPASQAAINMKRLATGVKSICGVLVDWSEG
jgi:threonine dehydrogenase-like Zn-dependent dehydrogenase